MRVQLTYTAYTKYIQKVCWPHLVSGLGCPVDAAIFMTRTFVCLFVWLVGCLLACLCWPQELQQSNGGRHRCCVDAAVADGYERGPEASEGEAVACQSAAYAGSARTTAEQRVLRCVKDIYIYIYVPTLV